MEPSPLSLLAAGGPFAPADINADQILVVDDETNIRKTLLLYLTHQGYKTVEASNGREALDKLKAGGIFLVVTDISMPDMGGIELVGNIRQQFPGIDVVFITGHVDAKYAIEAIKHGAFDFLRKPLDYEEVILVANRVKERQDLHKKAIALERLMERERIKDEHLLETMSAFASFIDAKSPYTRKHSDRVSRYSIRLARCLGLNREQTRIIAFGAKIHDIGKIGVPDSILNKPGPLTNDERLLIMKHPEIGEQCLNPISHFHPFICMVCGHHEHFDGTGYPKGLKAQETPLEARIVKIADYFDAITSDRPYRTPMPFIEAAEFLRHQVHKALDPELTPIFIDDVIRREKRRQNKRLVEVMPGLPNSDPASERS